MKDLILVGSYCPDDERETLLLNLVNQLQEVRNEFDILICSHTIIPNHISKKVDMVFYDKDNELITEMEYMNQPWFSPFSGKLILSTLISPASTYLAVYKLLIAGLGIGKVLGYKKIHYIEYDTEFNEFEELNIHSKLLDDYDWVAIKGDNIDFANNIDWPVGNFMSFKVDTLNDIFTKYDRKSLLDILLNSRNKTNEKITTDIMKSNGKKVYIRDFKKEVSKKNTFGLSRNTSKETSSYWAVPFYDTIEDRVFIIVWNHRDFGPIDVTFIINKDRVINFEKVQKSHWHLREVGKIEEINSIMVIINGVINKNIIFDDKFRETFKKTNYTITQ